MIAADTRECQVLVGDKETGIITRHHISNVRIIT